MKEKLLKNLLPNFEYYISQESVWEVRKDIRLTIRYPKGYTLRHREGNDADIQKSDECCLSTRYRGKELDLIPISNRGGKPAGVFDSNPVNKDIHIPF